MASMCDTPDQDDSFSFDSFSFSDFTDAIHESHSSIKHKRRLENARECSNIVLEHVSNNGSKRKRPLKYLFDSPPSSNSNDLEYSTCFNSPVTPTKMRDSPLFCNSMSSVDDNPYLLSLSRLGDQSQNTSHLINEFSKICSQDRLEFLSSLVLKCSRRELVHLQSVLQPILKRDFISQLPPEIGIKILSYLSPKDLLTCARVSRHWRHISEDNILWRNICIITGTSLEEEATDILSIETPYHHQTSLPNMNNCTLPASNLSSYRKNSFQLSSASIRQSDDDFRYSLSINNQFIHPNELIPRNRWKIAYLHKKRLHCNWQYGTNRPPIILKGHQDHVITCLEFYKDKVISASDDSTIKVWNVYSGECVCTLCGHYGGVWSSVMLDHYFVSGSTDRSVRVWDMEKLECVANLQGHISTVRCLDAYGRRVVSGSRDTALRIWDIDLRECVALLSGHRAAVRCVRYIKNRIVSGSYDSTVIVWDADTQECLHVLREHLNRVYTLAFDGQWIVSGSLDTTIRVWDCETGLLKQTLYGHESLTSGMVLKDNVLISSNADATVRVWDLKTGQCIHILAGVNKHKSALTCIQVTDNFIVSASDDGTVKLWDLHTGAFLRNLVCLEHSGSGGVIWRILASKDRLVCAAGSRNGIEETKLIVLHFDPLAPIPNPVSEAPINLTMDSFDELCCAAKSQSESCHVRVELNPPERHVCQKYPLSVCSLLQE